MNWNGLKCRDTVCDTLDSKEQTETSHEQRKQNTYFYDITPQKMESGVLVTIDQNSHCSFEMIASIEMIGKDPCQASGLLPRLDQLYQEWNHSACYSISGCARKIKQINRVTALII